MMPFHMGPTELILILVVVMIVFGVGKLPQIGGALGKGIREFRKGTTGEAGEPEATKNSPKKEETS